jgi:hypothetical protein
MLALPQGSWPSLRSRHEAGLHGLHALRFREYKIGRPLQLECSVLEASHTLSECWFVIHMNI